MNPDNSGWKDNATLRLVWPQWQGAGTESVRTWLPEFPFEVARRGYAAGTAVLSAILPHHPGTTAAVPVEVGDAGLAGRDGVEAKDSILTQLAAALEGTASRDPSRPWPRGNAWSGRRGSRSRRRRSGCSSTNWRAGRSRRTSRGETRAARARRR